MRQLVKIRPAENQFRFYAVDVLPGLFGNWAVVREWGRIGQPGTLRRDWYNSQEQAEQEAGKLIERKTRRGYQVSGHPAPP